MNNGTNSVDVKNKIPEQLCISVGKPLSPYENIDNDCHENIKANQIYFLQKKIKDN